MTDDSVKDLRGKMDDPDNLTPLRERAWSFMPEGAREIVSTAPIIPAVVSKAKVIAAEHPDFIRSDQGQVIGVFPEKEIFYGPSAGSNELRELIAKFWTLAYRLEGKPGIPPGGLKMSHVAIVSGATEGLSILLNLFAHNQKVGIMHHHWSNYKGIIRNSGGEPVVVSLFDEDYAFDPEGAEKTIRSEKVTSLLINFPANPSGDVLNDDELKAQGLQEGAAIFKVKN